MPSWYQNCQYWFLAVSPTHASHLYQFHPAGTLLHWPLLCHLLSSTLPLCGGLIQKQFVGIWFPRFLRSVNVYVFSSTFVREGCRKYPTRIYVNPWTVRPQTLAGICITWCRTRVLWRYDDHQRHEIITHLKQQRLMWPSPQCEAESGCPGLRGDACTPTQA